MCNGSKTKPDPCEMDAASQQSLKTCSKLLELAAMDDLSSFIREAESRGCGIDEPSFWYGRSFGSKKMGFEERTPLMVASLYGSTQVLDYIIRTGRVDVNRACGSDRVTALHCAAAGGSFSCIEVVKTLLQALADSDALDANGRRPGDLIPPWVKSPAPSMKKTLEILLNGVCLDNFNFENPKEVTEKTTKDYPVYVSLPDINEGIYGTDEFRMYSFKVKTCSRAYPHDWTECPFVHPGENARRRDPRRYPYTCVPCPEFKKGSCNKGDSCEYAHGVFESWLHPAQYRTRLCKDETGCSRKVCFFAHKPEELRPLYASTGSGLPSPKPAVVGSPDVSGLCPLKLGPPSLTMHVNTSTQPISPSIALQLNSSRLKTGSNAREVDFDMDLLGVEKIRTQMMIEEMANLSSPYSRINDLKPKNLDDLFGSSLDPSLSPQLQSPNGLQMRRGPNQLRSSYPSNIGSSPVRRYGFDSSAAVAQAVMNSRSSAFAKRSQSFADRPGLNYRSGLSGSGNPPSPIATSKFAERVDWGFNGQEDVSKLKKSASFGIRSFDKTKLPSLNADEPDVSWVSSLVRDDNHWFDQMYMEQEQIVA